MGVELAFDGGEIRLGDVVFGVAFEIWFNGSGDGPAGPGAPLANFFSWRTKAIGVVLKMDSWVSDENVLRREGDHVCDRLVRQRELVEAGFVSLEIRSHGPVEAEDGSSRQFA